MMFARGQAMGRATPASPEAFLDGHPDALAMYRRVVSMLEPLGEVEIRTSIAEIAFRRRRGFAYLWLPGRWLSKPAADLVLSITLDRRIDSDRFKQVVQPAPTTWMHHLELRSIRDLDDEVEAWLREAFDRAAR